MKFPSVNTHKNKTMFNAYVNAGEKWEFNRDEKMEIIAPIITVKVLSTDFKILIKERDELIESKSYNDRCYQIDDQLIPDIINQVPKEMMSSFNELINSND